MNEDSRPETSAPGRDDYLALQHAPVAGYMRLHHFFDLVIDEYVHGDESPAKLALMGDVTEAEIALAIRIEARAMVRKRDQMKQDTAQAGSSEFRYIYDVIGDWSLKKVERWMEAAMAELGRLSLEPDHAVMKLGVTKDRTCDGCAFGHHCTIADLALYLDQVPNGVEVVTGVIPHEERALNDIAGHLEAVELEHGKDYVVGREEIMLKDREGVFIAVDAPYMLLTLAAVRKLLAP